PAAPGMAGPGPPPAPVGVGAPLAAGCASTTAGADSNWTSLTAIGCGNSTCNHIPGCCAWPEVHGPMLSAHEAVAGLGLAVTFQPLSTSAIRGSVDSISVTVHG